MAKQAAKKTPAKKAAKPAKKSASPVASKSGGAKSGARAKPTPAPARSQPARTQAVGSMTTGIQRPPRETARRDAVIQNPAPPMAPVPTNGKPRKNQAGLSSKELEHFRDLLLAKRREIVGDMGQMEREALRGASGSNLSNLPLHMADMGTDNYEQEFTLGLVEKDRNLLRDLNTALAKIQDGSYGICEGTGKPISKVRLEAQPWARYSIEHARAMEKGFIR